MIFHNVFKIIIKVYWKLNIFSAKRENPRKTTGNGWQDWHQNEGIYTLCMHSLSLVQDLQFSFWPSLRYVKITNHHASTPIAPWPSQPSSSSCPLCCGTWCCPPGCAQDHPHATCLSRAEYVSLLGQECHTLYWICISGELEVVGCVRLTKCVPICTASF